jgi:hypothetical protein
VFVPGVDDLLKRGLLFENSLRLIAVVPEIRARSDLGQLVDSFLFSFEVKDASAEARAVLPDGSVVRMYLPAFCRPILFLIILGLLAGHKARDRPYSPSVA